MGWLYCECLATPRFQIGSNWGSRTSRASYASSTLIAAPATVSGKATLPTRGSRQKPSSCSWSMGVWDRASIQSSYDFAGALLPPIAIPHGHDPNFEGLAALPETKP